MRTTQKAIRKLLRGSAAVALFTLLTGCPLLPPPPVADDRVGFTGLLKSVLSADPDTATPVAVDVDAGFRFNESPAAFADILAGSVPVPAPSMPPAE